MASILTGSFSLSEALPNWPFKTEDIKRTFDFVTKVPFARPMKAEPVVVPFFTSLSLGKSSPAAILTVSAVTKEGFNLTLSGRSVEVAMVSYVAAVPDDNIMLGIHDIAPDSLCASPALSPLGDCRATNRNVIVNVPYARRFAEKPAGLHVALAGIGVDTTVDDKDSSSPHDTAIIVRPLASKRSSFDVNVGTAGTTDIELVKLAYVAVGNESIGRTGFIEFSALTVPNMRKQLRSSFGGRPRSVTLPKPVVPETFTVPCLGIRSMHTQTSAPRLFITSDQKEVRAAIYGKTTLDLAEVSWISVSESVELAGSLTQIAWPPTL